MIFSARRSELLAQVRTVARAASSSHPTKELAGILFETDGRSGVIRMTATNLEVSVRATMPATIERDGNTLINARLLLNLLNHLPGDDVYMELNENGQLYMRSGTPQYTLAVLDSKNYPKIDIPHPGDTVSVKGVKTLIKARKNGYAYGRGEKYTIEYGNDLGRVLTSEFSMLAVPDAVPLFLRKYQGKRLKQYKRREPIFKGCGDIIMCLDESDSTAEDAPWGKAVALALLDAAMSGGRKFALIHFSGTGSYKTDLFIPGQYDTADVFAAAETFLKGGTNFETPLKEALRIIELEGFENADIVFVTDGECSLSEKFREGFRQKQSAHEFTITGVLMDNVSPGMEFSLTPFCDDIYRTSAIGQDRIVGALITKRV